jgi:trigger factor
MQVTETLSEGLKRGFAITVPASDIEEKRTKRLTELGKTVKIPGFRPGKVPMTVVRQRFGSAVMSEILEESVNTATQQVLTDRGLRAATQPKVDVKELADKQDLEFTVELELLPDVPMPDFSAIQLTRLKATPSDEAVDRALAGLAERHRDLEPVTEDRGAESGDTLTVDFVGKIDGEPFAGGTGSDAPVEIGGSGFIPGFAEGIAGMRPGEQRTIDVTFPENYPSQDVAGKAATFDITAKKLERKVEQPLDDSFATKLGFESLQELRDLLAGQFQREYDNASRLRIKRELLDALAAAATFDIPPSMAEAEFTSIWQRVEADMKQGKLDEEDKGKDEATLRTEYRAIAERRVRLGLLLSEIGRSNGLQVQPEEMTRAIRAEAARYPGQEQMVMEFFRKNPAAANGLRGPIFEDKVVDFILELAKVEEKTVTPEELAAEPAPTAAA